MEKTVIFSKRQMWRDEGRETLKCQFKFSLIDSSLIGTPKEYATTHIIKMTITEELLINWGIETPPGSNVTEEMIKIAFQIAEDHITDELKKGPLPEGELPPLLLTTTTSPETCPYNIPNIAYPDKTSFIVTLPEVQKRLGKFGFKDNTSFLTDLRVAVEKYNLASVLFLDLDNFKAVNDNYDHATGDQVIREALGVVQNVIQNEGELFHRSGDEMIVLLPDLNDLDARNVAERIRSAIEEKYFSVIGPGVITSTIGLATYPETCERWEELEDVADRTAMRAKKIKKNRVANCLENFVIPPHLLSKSKFQIEISAGHRTKYKHGENDVWRNHHQISFLIRPERTVEVEVAFAASQEQKDALSIVFIFGGEQHRWDKIRLKLKEFIDKHNINWVSYEEFSWGDSWIIFGEHLTSYFTGLSRLNWLNDHFSVPPRWHSSPRSGTSDPTNSSSIEFTLLEP